jgi:hypothetical protein
MAGCVGSPRGALRLPEASRVGPVWLTRAAPCSPQRPARRRRRRAAGARRAPDDRGGASPRLAAPRKRRYPQRSPGAVFGGSPDARAAPRLLAAVTRARSGCCRRCAVCVAVTGPRVGGAKTSSGAGRSSRSAGARSRAAPSGRYTSDPAPCAPRLPRAASHLASQRAWRAEWRAPTPPTPLAGRLRTPATLLGSRGSRGRAGSASSSAGRAASPPSADWRDAVTDADLAQLRAALGEPAPPGAAARDDGAPRPARIMPPCAWLREPGAPAPLPAA